MKYINVEQCAKCGGVCCKRYPGAAFPADIINNFGDDMSLALVAALQSGYTIDCWEGGLGEGYPRPSGYGAGDDYDDYHEAEPGYHTGYYIRPRCEGDYGVYNSTWGGRCDFLTDAGCELAHDLRPTGCRMLEPGQEGCKVHGGGKLDSAKAWWEYYEDIVRAGSMVEQEGGS